MRRDRQAVAVERGPAPARAILTVGALASLLLASCGPAIDATGATDQTTAATGDDPTTDDPTIASTTASTSASATTSTTASTTTVDDATTSTGEPGPVCGDGSLDPGEACDDGDADDDDACLSDCQPARCGDGHVQVGVEACDDGDDDDTDACLSTCVAAKCGDGLLGPGEGCDDGNGVDDDACTNACAPASCGDGAVQVGEACDDGDDDDTDACLATCVAAKCGDGHVQAGVEGCDDGNDDDLDACSDACKPATCFDGVANKAETDVDCGGGGSCFPCAYEQGCQLGADCWSGVCTDGACESGLKPPACAVEGVTAVEVFDLVVEPRCGPCHLGGMMSGGLDMQGAAAVQANLVGVPSQGAKLPRVTAGDLDASYLLYKILDVTVNAPGGGGEAMPLDGPLTDAQKCVIVNWVKSGAK